MKLLCTLLMLCTAALQLLSQKTIRWKFDERKDSVFADQVIIKIDNIAIGDSILFGDSRKKILCVLDGKADLFLKVIDKAVQVKYCRDSVSIPISDDNKIDLIRNENFSLTLSVLNKDNKDDQADITNTKKDPFEETKNIYYDAYTLFKGSPKDKKAVFIKYQVDSTNKFLDTLLVKNNAILKRDPGGLQSAGISGLPSSSNLPFYDVTRIVDGFAKFIAARVKKELVISFFNKFSTFIHDTKLKDAQVLFKNTYEVLDLMGERIYDYQPYLSSLRQSMEYDYKSLTRSLVRLVNDNESQLSNQLDKNKNQRFLSSVAISFGNSIQEKVRIGQALTDLETLRFSDKTDTSLIAIVQSLQLFSEALKDSSKSEKAPYWVDGAKINYLIKNEEFLKCFVGLITQEAKMNSINLGHGISVFEYLNYKIGPDNLSNFSILIKNLQHTITNIQSIQSKDFNSLELKEKEQNIINYFDAGIDLLQCSYYLVDLFNLSQEKEQINKLISISTNINGIIKHISINKYSLASIQLSKFFNTLKTNKEDGLFSTIEFIVDHSLFFAQMAEADSSDQVAEILETFAAPIGSWRDKRETNLNIALDSYVGPAAFITNDNQRIALSTPVGLSLTFPINDYQMSFLLSAVDIGPATAFRFKNDTSEVSKITLGEILSPGIFTSINFGKSFPLTFNVGYQQYPLLKRVNNQSNDYNEYRKGGLSVSFNMNIPILTLFNQRGNEE